MSRDFFGLNGRIVIVSGAGGGGIGTSVTKLVAEAGATVIAVSRSKENLATHIEPLAAQGLSVIPVAAESLCVHGDGAQAVLVLRAVRQGLAAAGISVAPFSR